MNITELTKELSDMAVLMEELGDLRKATVLKDGAERLRQLCEESDRLHRQLAQCESGYSAARHLDRAEIKDLREKLESERAEREKMIESIRKTDISCDWCRYSAAPAPCIDDEEAFATCDDCRYECICKTCRDNDKYVFDRERFLSRGGSLRG